MDVLQWVLFGVLPALAVVLLGVGIGGSRWLALALAVALCVPFALAMGLPDWPWRLDWRQGPARPWLWWCLLAAGLLGTLGDARWLPKALAAALQCTLLVALPWLLTGPLRGGWSFEQHVLWLGLALAVAAMNWSALHAGGRAGGGMLAIVVGLLVLAVDAWLLRARGTGILWHTAGVGAMALLFALLTTTWRRPLVCGPGAQFAIAFAHVGVLWCGASLHEARSLPLVLAAAVPLPLWLVGAHSLARSPRLAISLAALGCAGLAAAAVWLG